MIETKPYIKKSVVVSLADQGTSEWQIDEHLDEMAFLAHTNGMDTIGSFTQKLPHPDVSTYIGKGKLEEIKAFTDEHDVDCILFDGDLSPSQVRNLEKFLKKKIYDRSLLILDIFRMRAQTAQAKTQVELARYQYLLPRLTGMWTHLERQRGGTGTRGGAGEKEIETDRRIVRDQITLLKKKLQKIDNQMRTRRKARENAVRVSLIGYTNVGKSTLMNLITKSQIKAENKLFATVDSTVRRTAIYDIPFLLSDTVGFIRKLPTHLIESFKSTLDEVREADILLHVVDIANPAYEEHISVVNQVLSEIGASNKKIILIFNKIDELPSSFFEKENPLSLVEKEELLSRSYAARHPSDDVVFISAKEKFNLDKLRESLYTIAGERYFEIYPHYKNKEAYYFIHQKQKERT